MCYDAIQGCRITLNKSFFIKELILKKTKNIKFPTTNQLLQRLDFFKNINLKSFIIVLASIQLYYFTCKYSTLQ